jgi:hypothetical protein
MSLSGDLRTYLLADSNITTLLSASTAIYRNIVPQSASLPAVSYSIDGSKEGYTHDGADGLYTTEITFAVGSLSMVTTDAIINAIYNRINAYSGTMGSTTVGLITVEIDGDALTLTQGNETKIFGKEIYLTVIHN